jgi:hypothetical protein
VPTETEIVNAALRRGGGAKRILDLTDSVGSAGIASDVLASERDDLLRAGVWNFAVTRIQLGQLSALPAFGWSFAYALPADCERVVSVHDNDAGLGAVPYKIEAVKQADDTYINCIVTDSNSIFLRYCRQITDPNLMSASFRQVLILRMAKIFAISLAKSNPLFQALDAEEQKAFRKAMSVDGIENMSDPLPEGSWASSRRAYGWQRDGSIWPR